MQPRRLHRLRQLIVPRRTRRTGPSAVLEGEGRGETHLLDQTHGVVKVGVALAREADDEVGREGYFGTRGAQAVDDAQEEIAAVTAVHRLEDAVRARLHRQ